MRDEIRIKGLKVFAHHGVFEEETVNGQNFYVNCTMYTDTAPAGRKDDLTLSTHYGEVSLFIDKWMKENTCKLLETVAERLSREILLRYPLIHELDLEIEKPEAPIPLPFETVSVKVRRGWHRAYVAVGSNMGDKGNYIADAVKALEEHKLIRNLRVSEIIETKPYGGVEQDVFLNGAMALDTLMDPTELLDALHEIENQAGRTRTIHWGPRTLDLDIIFYDDLVYESEDLKIPHVDMQNRDFVLKPLNELCPRYIHPVLGKSVAELLSILPER